jgi:hypothetical protein
MNRTTITALLAATTVAVPLIGATAASADDSAAAQQRYVTSLVVAHRDAADWNASADYARCLEYWAQHPDWGLGK